MMYVRMLKVGESLPVNEKLAGIVPLASEDEQVALTDDIKANGLREPVVLWKGEIVDGRCRQKACLITGTPILARDLDDELTEEEVKIFVKSANTRRNLTNTQKVMVACRESLSGSGKSVRDIAKSWGISNALLVNARYITEKAPELAEALFNGKSVEIIDSKGRVTTSNKVSAVYAYLRRNKVSDSKVEHGWDEASYIQTQEGKDWYYSTVGHITDIATRQLIAELANYKFPSKD